MSTLTVADVATDLVAEQQALDAVVAELDDRAWDVPTPAPGWTVGDQVAHLTYFDGTATRAITDPDGFRSSAWPRTPGCRGTDRPWAASRS